MGFDETACLSFDLACLEFDTRYQREADATREVPAPKTTGRAMTLAPLHDLETLRHFLGLEPTPAAQLAVDPRVTDLVAELLRGEADWLDNPRGLA